MQQQALVLALCVRLAGLTQTAILPLPVQTAMSGGMRLQENTGQRLA